LPNPTIRREEDVGGILVGSVRIVVEAFWWTLGMTHETLR